MAKATCVYSTPSTPIPQRFPDIERQARNLRAQLIYLQTYVQALEVLLGLIEEARQ